MKFLFFFIVLFCTSIASACPDEVLLIRHGEKIQGVPNLSPQGKLRAKRLAILFSTPNAAFQKPTHIVAVADASNRPAETCLPTAHALNLPINLSYTLDQEENGQMADYLLQQSGTPLVCLEHNRIPAMVKHLTADQLDLGKWRDDVFDQILILHFKEVNGECQFINYEDVRENVLHLKHVPTSCCTHLKEK